MKRYRYLYQLLRTIVNLYYEQYCNNNFIVFQRNP